MYYISTRDSTTLQLDLFIVKRPPTTMVSPSPSVPSTSSSFPIASAHLGQRNQPDGTSSSNVSSTALVTPPELEQTLSMLSSHRTVLGYLLLSRTAPVKIIRHSGVVFEGEQGRRYAAVVSKIVEAVHSGLESVGVDGADADELRFMRIRTKRHELMISPDERYLLAVLHDPQS
ncbi:NAA38_2 [Sanghuangporus weigelae]